MNVSIIYNSVYDGRYIDRIVECAKQLKGKYSYEILGYGTQQVDAKVDYHEQVTPEQDAINGYSVYGFNHLADLSQGELIFIAPEDCIYPDITKAIDEAFSLDRKYKVSTYRSLTGGPCYTHNYGPADKLIPDAHRDIFYDGREYITARFPIIHRKTFVELLGSTVFNKSFKHHCCDLWLGYYIGFMESSLEETVSTYSYNTDPAVNSQFDVYDMNQYYLLKKNLLNNINTRYEQIV